MPFVIVYLYQVKESKPVRGQRIAGCEADALEQTDLCAFYSFPLIARNLLVLSILSCYFDRRERGAQVNATVYCK
jgi:hypothetical protein